MFEFSFTFVWAGLEDVFRATLGFESSRDLVFEWCNLYLDFVSRVCGRYNMKSVHAGVEGGMMYVGVYI